MEGLKEAEQNNLRSESLAQAVEEREKGLQAARLGTQRQAENTMLSRVAKEYEEQKKKESAEATDARATFNEDLEQCVQAVDREVEEEKTERENQILIRDDNSEAGRIETEMTNIPYSARRLITHDNENEDVV